MRKLHKMLGVLVLLALMTSLVYAAEEGAATGGRRGRGEAGAARQGGFGGAGQGGFNFDPAAMQERMVEMMKDRIGATDEEWTVIKPRLSEVMKLSQSGRMMGRMGRMGRRGGRGGRGGAEATTETPEITDPVQKASAELQETMDKEAPTSAEIKAKLAALRGAREKNKQKLVAAQEKLKEVLSVKQEAMLVMSGTLE